MNVRETRRRNLIRLLERHRTQKAFAEETDTVAAHLSQIVNKTRNMGEDVARRIEERLHLQDGWMDAPHGKSEELTNTGNTTPGPDIRGQLPLISWVRAGAWTEVQDPLAVGEYERLIPVTRRYSDRAYALRIDGDSMQAPDGPSFPNGAIICVEPRQEPRNGSFVIVRLEDTKEATFKQLVIDGDRRYLKPLNPRYPILEITGEAVFCGVVRQLVMDFE